MTGKFKPCLDILPSAQRQLWPELRKAPELGFALYGGTAIALRLGHRDSVDFDLFSEKPLDRDAIKAAFPFVAQSTTLQDQGNAWTVLAPYGNSEREHVKVSFFGTIAFGRVGEPEFTEDRVLQVASLDDLMATKVKVVLQRAEAKDYRDVAAMVNAGVSLSRGLAAARVMFGANFQPSESLKALVYFNDGDLKTLSAADRAILVHAVTAVRDLPEVALQSSSLTIESRSLSEPRLSQQWQASPGKRQEVGRVVAMSSDEVIQDAGRGRYVAWDRRKLRDDSLAVGESVTIHDDGSVGRHRPDRDRGR